MDDLYWTDRQLWERGCAGDTAAFGALFDRHADAVYNYLCRRLETPADVEDLTSAVFLHAWRRRHEVALDRDGVLPWLLAVARHCAHTRRRHRDALARLPVDPPVADHAQSVADRLDDTAELARVPAAVGRLPTRERDVVELCLYSGLDQQAAAVALGIPVGTVKSRRSRARRRLGHTLTTPVRPDLEALQ